MIALIRTHALWFIFGLFCVSHWAGASVPVMGLQFDEAQYWTWAKQPDLGYYSKPPMIAWLIAASTWLLGNAEWGVRFFAPLLHVAAALAVYGIARHFAAGPFTARLCAIAYVTLPGVWLSAAVISTDAPLMACWAIAIYAWLRATQKPELLRYWLLLGVMMGAGMLSKYTMAACGISMAAYVIQQGKYALLRARGVWLSVIIAVLVWLPNGWWNLHHGLVTFAHTEENMLSHSDANAPASHSNLLEFVASQVALFGPIMVVLLLCAMRRTAGLSVFIWPLALAGLTLSIISQAQAQWIAPVYVAGVIAVVIAAEQSAQMQRWLRISIGLHVALCAAFYPAAYAVQRSSTHVLWFDQLRAWNDTAQQLRQIQQTPENVQIYAEERKMIASLQYRLRDENGVPGDVAKWNPNHLRRDYYDMQPFIPLAESKRNILVSRANGQELLHTYYPAIKQLKLLQTIPYGKKRQIYFYAISGQEYAP